MNLSLDCGLYLASLHFTSNKMMSQNLSMLGFADHAKHPVTFGHLPFEIRYHIFRINTRAAFEKRKQHCEKLFDDIPRIIHQHDEGLGTCALVIIKVKLRRSSRKQKINFVYFKNDDGKESFSVYFDKVINSCEHLDITFMSQDRVLWNLESDSNTTLEEYNDPDIECCSSKSSQSIEIL